MPDSPHEDIFRKQRKLVKRSGRGSKKSTKPLKDAQKLSDPNQTPPDIHFKPEDAISLASNSLHLHQIPITSSSLHPVTEIDGVIPLSSTTRHAAESGVPVSHVRSQAAVTQSLHEGGLDFSGLNSGSYSIKFATPLADIQAQSEATSPLQAESQANANYMKVSDRRGELQEASTPSPESEKGFEQENTIDEDITEPGLRVRSAVESSEEGTGDSETESMETAAPEGIEAEAQRVERKDALHAAHEAEPGAEIIEEVLLHEVNEESAQADEEEDAEVASIMSIAEAESVAVPAAAIEEAEEVRSMSLSPEASELPEVVADSPAPLQEEIELKEEAKEEVFFAQQLEHQKPKEERSMSKLFELPSFTPEQKETNVDIKYAFGLIDEGAQQLRDQEERGLIIFGKSKSGKSALHNVLSERQQVAYELTDGWDIVLSNPGTHSEGAAVSSGGGSPVGRDPYRSETQIPYKSTLRGTAIIDVPGFFDTKGFAIDAAHSMLYARTLKNTANLKLALAVTRNTICSIGEQYKPFIDQVTHFAKMFADIEVIKGSIALVVIKAGRAKNTAEQFKKIIAEILADHPLVKNPEVGSEGELARKVLEYVQDSVKVFYEPEGEGEMKPELRLEDFDSLNFTTAHHAKSPLSRVDADASAMPVPPASPASGAVSSSFLTGTDAMFMEKYKAKAEETLKQLQADIIIVNNMILSFFKEQLSLNNPESPEANQASMHFPESFIHKPLLQKDKPNIFSNFYSGFTRELLPDNYDKIEHPDENFYLGEYNRDTHFLKLHHASCILKEALKPRQGKSEAQKLIDVLRVLKSLCNEVEHTEPDANPGVVQKSGDEQKEAGTPPAIPLSKQIGGCIHIFKRLVEFEEFCRKLCGVGQQTDLLADTVRECTALVNNIFTGALNDLVAAPREFSIPGDSKTRTLEYSYREKIIKWLEQSPDQKNPQVIEAKALNHYYMGLICHKLKDDEEGAIEHYQKAISLDKEMKSVLQDSTFAHLHETTDFAQGIKDVQKNLGSIYLAQAKKLEKEISRLETKNEMQEEMHREIEEIRSLKSLLLSLSQTKDQKASKDAAQVYGVRTVPEQLKKQVDAAVMSCELREPSVSITKREKDIQNKTAQTVNLYKAAMDLFEASDNQVHTQMCFKGVLKKDPCDIETLVKKGDHFMKFGNPSKAQKAYSIAQELCAKDSPQQQEILQKAFDAARLCTTPEGLCRNLDFKAFMDKSGHYSLIFSSPDASKCSTPFPAYRIIGADSSPDNSTAGSPSLGTSRALSPAGRDISSPPCPASPETLVTSSSSSGGADYLKPPVVDITGAAAASVAEE